MNRKYYPSTTEYFVTYKIASDDCDDTYTISVILRGTVKAGFIYNTIFKHIQEVESCDTDVIILSIVRL